MAKTAKVTKARAGASVPPSQYHKSPGYKKLKQKLTTDRLNKTIGDEARKERQKVTRRQWEI